MANWMSNGRLAVSYHRGRGDRESPLCNIDIRKWGTFRSSPSVSSPFLSCEKVTAMQNEKNENSYLRSLLKIPGFGNSHRLHP